MATITVEDGTGKTDSNSYCSETVLGTYATDRGITLVADTDQKKSILLIQAMDYVEQQNFKGCKYTDAQALQWPRGAVYIDGYYVDADTIPQLLIDALCEVCIGIDGGTNPLANVTRETKMEKVGEIAVEYMDSARDSTYLKAAETKLTKLLRSGGYRVNAEVIRA